MVIAAMICFAILLVAWLLAPSRSRTATEVAMPDPELQPILEAT
jgi:hypothetical protein